MIVLGTTTAATARPAASARHGHTADAARCQGQAGQHCRSDGGRAARAGAGLRTVVHVSCVNAVQVAADVQARPRETRDMLLDNIRRSSAASLRKVEVPSAPAAADPRNTLLSQLRCKEPAARLKKTELAPPAPADARNVLLSAIRDFKSTSSLKSATSPAPAVDTPPPTPAASSVLDSRSALLFSISSFGKTKRLKELPRQQRPSQKQLNPKALASAQGGASSMQAAINKVGRCGRRVELIAQQVLGDRRKALDRRTSDAGWSSGWI